MKNNNLKHYEDEIFRSLLLMKYDTKKTLTENISTNKNKKFLSEAAVADPNIVTDQDLMGSTNVLRSLVQTYADFNTIVPGLSMISLADMAGGNLANTVLGRRMGVKGVVDALDNWVGADDLLYTLSIVVSLIGKCYIDDTVDPPVKGPAIKRFLELYKEDENGDDLIRDVMSVGTTTLPTGSEKIKKQIVNAILKATKTPCAGAPNPELKCDGPNPDPGCPQKKKREDEKKPIPTPGKWKNCDSSFPIVKFCTGSKVTEIQGCIGATADGKFGGGTEAKLKQKGYKTTIDQAEYDKIIKNCKGSTDTDEKKSEIIPTNVGDNDIL